MKKTLLTAGMLALLGGCASQNSGNYDLAMAEKLVSLHKEAQQQNKKVEITGDGPFRSHRVDRFDANLWDISIDKGVLVIKPSELALKKNADAAGFAFYVAPETIKYIQREGNSNNMRYYRAFLDGMSGRD